MAESRIREPPFSRSTCGGERRDEQAEWSRVGGGGRRKKTRYRGKNELKAFYRESKTILRKGRKGIVGKGVVGGTSLKSRT